MKYRCTNSSIECVIVLTLAYLTVQRLVCNVIRIVIFFVNSSENAQKAVMAGLLLQTFSWLWTSGLITNMLSTFFPTWTFVTSLRLCSFTSIKRVKQQNLQVWVGLKNRPTELGTRNHCPVNCGLFNWGVLVPLVFVEKKSKNSYLVCMEIMLFRI